jgi:hypothetical protein
VVGEQDQLRDDSGAARGGRARARRRDRIEIERLSLDDALDGYRRLRKSAVVGRAVAVP